MKYSFIHERGDYPLLAFDEIVSVWTSSIKKVVGHGETPIFFIYRSGWVRIFSYEKQHQKIVKYVWRKIHRDRKYVTWVRLELIKRAKVFLEFAKSIQLLDLKKTSNADLTKIKQRYIELYHQVVPYGEPVPYFLKEKLQTTLDNLLLLKKKVPVNVYEKLVMPIHQSFIQREAFELYNLSKRYKGVKLHQAITKHARKYAWIYFDYAGRPLKVKDFSARLKKLKVNPPNKHSQALIRQVKKQLIKKYRLGSYITYLIKVLDDGYFLMDYKKEVLSQAHLAITQIYQEAGRRLGLSLDEVRWLSWKEVLAGLNGKLKSAKKTIRKRYRFSAFISTGGSLVALSNKKARRIEATINHDQKLSRKITQIRGVAGSPGRAIGRVRYLKSASEYHKVKKGEILVVSNTTPDFMPAMRLVKAVVTNEGGITCHAAVVSRELKIPCVVDTKIATQALKTGDKVEVNANHGLVKVVK